MVKDEDEIIRLLKKEYTTDFFSKQNDWDPYKVLVSCLISLRTKDDVTYPASLRLFGLADTPRKMMALDVRKIEKAIYPAGFYRTKARRIKEISGRLVRDYGSAVPADFDELMKFKGVGRKTANIVMVFGFQKMGIPVDTHVHKLSNRLGWVRTKRPEETEKALRQGLARKHWLAINELFVRHGQQVCLSISPWCSRCKIARYCRRVGVRVSR
jgi:endonuclease III